MTNHRFNILGLCLISFLFACQALPIKKINQSELLRDRIGQYIQARNANDLAKEYGFFSPAYREGVSLEAFKSGRNFEAGQTVLESMDYVEGSDTAEIVMTGSVEFMGYKFQKIKIVQTWIFVDKNWYQDAKKGSFKDMFDPKPVPQDKQ